LVVRDNVYVRVIRIVAAGLTALAVGALGSNASAQAPTIGASVIQSRISPDGVSIVFVLSESRGDRPPATSLWRIPFEGGQPQQISAMPLSLVRWSPDGLQIAYLPIASGPTSSSRVMLIPANGGTARPVGSAGIAAFEWRPNGREIACLTGEGGLQVVDRVSGRGRDVVMTASTRIVSFAWAPRGTTIAAITSSPNEISKVVVLDRGRVRAIANAGEAARQLAWSPDGGTLAWISGSASAAVLTQVSPNGAARHQVAGLLGVPLFVGWATSDTLSIAARLDAETILETQNVRSGFTEVIAGPGIVKIASAPSWSRDGKRYATVGAGPDHGSEVFVGTLPLPAANGSDTVGAPPPTVRRLTFVSRP
jgi:Tol biopolymer transport system component